MRWKEWKRPQTRYRNLRALGIPDRDARCWAASQKGYWRVAGSWPLQRALPNAYWHKTMGLKGFTEPYRGFRECSANRPVRTRMPGGVGGARASLASTRFCAGGGQQRSSLPATPRARAG